MEGYTKVRQIGKGNMGVCHLAKGPGGELAVLKQVNLSKMGRKEKTQAVGEAKLLKSVNHPNIVRFLNSCTTKNDNLLIAMEYVTKGDLCQKIEKSKGRGLWKEGQVLDWFIQIALAVQYTGKKHILHRDLKTQNILITEDNVLKLADFGISRSLVNTWDQAHTFVGTPYYLAPELVLQRPYNIQVDAWALGVVLCEMLTLSHPFTGYDMKSLTSNIVKGVYTKPSTQYSAEIRDLVTGLLQKDPAKRTTVKAALNTAIVQRRLKKWLTEDKVVPKSYVCQLIREGCLDGLIPSSLITGYKLEDESGVKVPHPPGKSTDAVLQDLERQRKDEKAKIRAEFSSIEAGNLKIHDPSPKSHQERGKKDLPPISGGGAGAGAGGAYPGHCPPAHPRELLAEKRRLLALLEQQQMQQQQKQRHPVAGARRFRNLNY
eukprot:TRINITY_DN37644_c0_g1_i1.p1 TRINITY_DN37644_c0_g1~~TRINITY_DN37644_c0_g1_i1.p1  ORF type:complete len:431 (+),score=86.44 TRINITY_DN37644_c0_g1_i1:71-1363(+)